MKKSYQILTDTNVENYNELMFLLRERLFGMQRIYTKE